MSQRAVRVVGEIIEGFTSGQPCSRLHAITIRPIWPCEDAPFGLHGGVRGVGVLPERLFTFFKKKIYKSFILKDAPSCTQNTTTLPEMGYTLLPSCFCLCGCQREFLGTRLEVEVVDREHIDILATEAAAMGLLITFTEVSRVNASLFCQLLLIWSFSRRN